MTCKLLNAGSYLLIGALAGVTFALWLTKSEVDDARDQLRTIYAQTPMAPASRQASNDRAEPARSSNRSRLWATDPEEQSRDSISTPDALPLSLFELRQPHAGFLDRTALAF